MTSFRQSLMAALALSSAVFAGIASATPITISNAGYWLETVGPNTIGLVNVPGGVVTTLFVASTTPLAAQGTTATASIAGTPVTPPNSSDPSLWARRVINPGAFQLQPLTVEFHNGTDTASFTGQDLSGVTPMPLAQNLAVDGSADPYRPTISWTLPTVAGIDIDVIQIVYYSNATNLEVGSRSLLPGSATSHTPSRPTPPGFDLTINVRFIDLADDSAGFSTGNILSESRAYINYLAPVPEPGTAAMLLLGLGMVTGATRLRTGRAHRH